MTNANLPLRSESRLNEIAQAAASITDSVNAIGEEIRRMYQGRHTDPVPPSRHVASTIQRTDEAFRLANEADRLLLELEQFPRTRLRAELCKQLQDARRRALRYNRQSLGCLERDPIAVIPLTHYRNFLRDGAEHMYFLALHDLPTAYDFFCCTYVETPAGYQQEIHLHRHSEELTLILEGSCDCVWYTEDIHGKLHEAGRVTANALQAFRIPAGVPHTIDSCRGANRNVTIKLSMFIEDRVGKRDWRFRRVHKSDQPVAVDSGEVSSEPWGRSIQYEHGHRHLRFNYFVWDLIPHKRIELPFGSQRHIFFLGERIRIFPQTAKPYVELNGNAIIRLDTCVTAQMENVDAKTAIVFVVEGLENERKDLDVRIAVPWSQKFS